MTRIALAALCSVLALAASSCVRSRSDADPRTERLREAAASSLPTAEAVAGKPPETSTRKEGIASIETAADQEGSQAVSQAAHRDGDASAAPAALPGSIAAGSAIASANVSAEPRNNNEGADSPSSHTSAGSPPANDGILEDDTTIYSSADDEVQPPTLLTRGFLGPLVNGVAVRRSLIELAISKSGSVERVQLLSRSQNMRDALLLSRAKQFQFRPASKNGIPVGYRVVIVVEEAVP
jgi:hypothetical protein